MTLPEQKFDVILEKLMTLEREGLVRKLPPYLTSYDVSRGTFEGKKKVIIFCSNDYLGMTRRKEVLDELKKGVDLYGGGAGASRLVSGNFAPHVEFEKFISDLFDLEKKGKSVLTFNSGWVANVGVISALCDEPSCEIFSDELNHASIIDGCRLSRGKVTVFPHLDLNYLEKTLRESRARFKLVVTDAVFSMDGDVASLKDLRWLCDRYGAVLYVDEAHSFGVFGENGKGLQEQMRVEADISLYTLSKAIGLCGAFVIAPTKVIEYLRSRARSFIFSTALPPYIYRAAVVSVRIAVTEHNLRRRLKDNLSYLIYKMREKIGEELSTSSHIVPFIIGDEFKAVKISRLLLERGIFVQSIRYPSVPRGTARLRITVTAVHTREDIETFTNALSDVLKDSRLNDIQRQ